MLHAELAAVGSELQQWELVEMHVALSLSALLLVLEPSQEPVWGSQSVQWVSRLVLSSVPSWPVWVKPTAHECVCKHRRIALMVHE